MSRSLEYMLEKFPDHRSKIIELFNDEDFRILCDDLLTSSQALEESRVNAIKDKEFQNEFSQAYVELEKEIIKLLGTHGKVK